MNRKLIISVNVDCAELFVEFAQLNPHEMVQVHHKTFIGGVELVDFIVELTPHLITAFTAYLVARLQNSRKEIKIKKGDFEIELKNTAMMPEETIELLNMLEQKKKRK